jgi:hypothetical protein
MKRKYNILILFSCLIFYSSNIIGQAINCGTPYFEGLMSTNDPNYSSRKAALEASIQDSIVYHHFDSLFARTSDISFGVTRIPVIVHVIGNDAANAVNSFAIQQALNDVNDLYRKKINTAGFGYGVDTEIEFCLAIKDETGFTISGIDLVPDGSHGDYGPFGMTDQDDIDIKTPTNVTPSRWSPNKYLNIWICDLGNSTKKVWGSSPTLYLSDPQKKYRDGVVIDMSNFNAKLLAHGIGHWLNLIHTFGADNSSCGTNANDDGCKDTPWCIGSAANLACNSLNDQCPISNTPPNHNRQLANYMDDSPVTCMNMFTLEQKNRMQSLFSLTNGRPNLNNNSIISCSVQPTCSDNIQNGTETGVDCGGTSCSPCPSCKRDVNFKINGHTTNWWDIVNVCNLYGFITLTPFDANCQNTNYRWDYSDASRYLKLTDDHTSLAINGGGPRHCAMGVNDKGYCYYAMLYVSIQECDENRNLIGSESGTWFNISSHLTGALNLHDFLYYLGNPLAAGKYFRIKVAAGNSQTWKEHSGFIKIFEPNVALVNKTITNAQVGDNISITNCVISSNINVVAANKIDIYNTTAITSGSYFINTFDCNSISTFRGSNTSLGNQANNLNTFNSSISKYNPENKELVKKYDKVFIIPNPNNGNFTITNDEKDGSLRSIEIQNAQGLIVKTVQTSSNSTDINIQDQAPGLYLVKLNFADKTITKKMIKQ